MRIAILTTDSREHFKDYTNSVPYFGSAPEALLQGFARISEIEVHVVSCLQQRVSSPEKLTDNIWFHALHVPKFGWMRSGYRGCICATRKKLREIRPDIVHGQGTERDCAIGAVLSGFPNILTIHGNMRLIAQLERARPFSFSWLAAKFERFTIPRSDGVVCITRYTREAVASLAKKTWLVPNAVDISFFDVDACPDAVEAPRILCVGAISSRKNQNALIRAVEPLARKREFELIFFGQSPDGQPYGDEFRRLVETRPWCSYEGFADREKLRQQFRKASLLVLPSLEDNCPMVVLEAMAAGVPVLASKVGGIPDLIEDGQNGVFCDPFDPVSIRSGIDRVLGDRDFASHLTTNSKRDAKARFHPEIIARQHLEIYRELLQRDS